MNVLLRTGILICIALLGCLSLIPSNMEFRTGLPGQIEHSVAYFCMGSVLVLTYPRQWLQCAIWLIAIAIILEALQSFSPGRTPLIIDAAASSAGAISGVVVAHCLLCIRKDRGS